MVHTQSVSGRSWSGNPFLLLQDSPVTPKFGIQGQGIWRRRDSLRHRRWLRSDQGVTRSDGSQWSDSRSSTCTDQPAVHNTDSPSVPDTGWHKRSEVRDQNLRKVRSLQDIRSLLVTDHTAIQTSGHCPDTLTRDHRSASLRNVNQKSRSYQHWSVLPSARGQIDSFQSGSGQGESETLLTNRSRFGHKTLSNEHRQAVLHTLKLKSPFLTQLRLPGAGRGVTQPVIAGHYRYSIITPVLDLPDTRTARPQVQTLAAQGAVRTSAVLDLSDRNATGQTPVEEKTAVEEYEPVSCDSNGPWKVNVASSVPSTTAFTDHLSAPFVTGRWDRTGQKTMDNADLCHPRPVIHPQQHIGQLSAPARPVICLPSTSAHPSEMIIGKILRRSQQQVPENTARDLISYLQRRTIDLNASMSKADLTNTEHRFGPDNHRSVHFSSEVLVGTDIAANNSQTANQLSTHLYPTELTSFTHDMAGGHSFVDRQTNLGKESSTDKKKNPSAREQVGKVDDERDKLTANHGQTDKSYGNTKSGFFSTHRARSPARWSVSNDDDEPAKYGSEHSPEENVPSISLIQGSMDGQNLGQGAACSPVPDSGCLCSGKHRNGVSKTEMTISPATSGEEQHEEITGVSSQRHAQSPHLRTPGVAQTVSDDVENLHKHFVPSVPDTGDSTKGHARDPLTPQPVPVSGASRPASRGEWIVCRDKTSAHIHSAQYGGHNNVWTRDCLVSSDHSQTSGQVLKTQCGKIDYQTNGQSDQDLSGVSNSLAQVIATSSQAGGSQSETTAHRTTHQTRANSDRKDHSHKHSHHLSHPHSGSHSRTNQHGHKTDHLTVSPRKQLLDSSEAQLASKLSWKLSELARSRSKKRSDSPGPGGQVVTATDRHFSRPATGKRASLRSRPHSVGPRGGYGPGSRDSSPISQTQQCPHTGQHSSADQVGKQYEHLRIHQPLRRELPVHQKLTGQAKSGMRSENKVDAGQFTRHLDVSCVSPAVTSSHVTQDWLDYFWSYQGMGRQILGVLYERRRTEQGREISNCSVLDKFQPLPPIEPSSSGLDAVTGTREQTDAQTDGHKEVQSDVAESSGKRRVQLVVKLPQSGEEEELM